MPKTGAIAGSVNMASIKKRPPMEWAKMRQASYIMGCTFGHNT